MAIEYKLALGVHSAPLIGLYSLTENKKAVLMPGVLNRMPTKETFIFIYIYPQLNNKLLLTQQFTQVNSHMDAFQFKGIVS
jgi:hypothetical protein